MVFKDYVNSNIRRRGKEREKKRRKEHTEENMPLVP